MGRNRPVANAVQARGGHAAKRIGRGRMADTRPRQQCAGQAQVACHEQGLHAEQIAAPFGVETQNHPQGFPDPPSMSRMYDKATKAQGVSC